MLQEAAAVSEAPEMSSSTPDGAKRQSHDLDELFGNLRKQKSAPSAEEDSGSDQDEEPSEEPEQQRKGKRKGEVEDLFAKLKKHRAVKADKQVLRKQLLGKRKPAGSKDDIFGKGITKARRRDADGFAIYSEEELGLSKGGNTPQCPFDCECCY
ncbi:g2354 [Coccomyxa viridis]|uniref:G2354 protein n=1 Tax=Coccomyxa viridis TaxID=1274662 RepID=A0ABP1FK73_9CHLO